MHYFLKKVNRITAEVINASDNIIYLNSVIYLLSQFYPYKKLHKLSETDLKI